MSSCSRARIAVGLALGSLACGPQEGDRTPERYSVLLVSLDSTRRDIVSVWGAPPRHAPDARTTPNLERLAARGVVIEEPYATTSWTLPSHVSMLTGRVELVHGVDLDYHRVSPSHPMAQEILGDHGYRTFGFFSGPYLEPAFGFDRGFDRYVACYGDELAQASERRRALEQQKAEAQRHGDAAALAALHEEQGRLGLQIEQLAQADVSSSAVTDGAIAAIEEATADDRPFFVFAHYFDPHYDYVPPEPLDRRFDPDYAGDVDGRGFFNNPRIGTLDPSVPWGRIRTVSDRDLEHVRALYEGELAWTDAQIGRLLDRLDELGLTERTLVVVTADHGDEFFEHGSIGHRRTLFEEVVRAPLILSLPAALPQGRRVPGLASTVDIVPTILDLVGIAPPPGLTGTSLVPRVEGRDDGAEHGVFGRIVVATEILFDVPIEGGGVRKEPGLLYTVTETYREGSIKVTRERSWPQSTGAGSESFEAQLAEQARAMRQEEALRWIDVTRHPDERPQDHSSDFSVPAARRTLRRFHDRYAELLERRGQAAHVVDAARVSDALRGLGYTGGEPGAADSDGSRFVLPPPGDDGSR